jgi:hypothetical protein
MNASLASPDVALTKRSNGRRALRAEVFTTDAKYGDLVVS